MRDGKWQYQNILLQTSFLLSSYLQGMQLIESLLSNLTFCFICVHRIDNPKSVLFLNWILSPVDDDECVSGTDNCDGNANCTNTEGSFTCQCNSGFNGDGETCEGKN